RLSVGRELAPVHGHPYVVPREHHDGDAEDGGVEELLAHALGELADLLGAEGDEDRACKAGGKPAHDVARAPRNSIRRGSDDAHDQRGFEDFAENDERGSEHGGYLATTTPLAVFSLNSPTNLYSPALSGPT